MSMIQYHIINVESGDREYIPVTIVARDHLSAGVAVLELIEVLLARGVISSDDVYQMLSPSIEGVNTIVYK